MASDAALKDLDISSEELDRLQKALKDETFRKMFVEYAEEISNPENRKLYEEEIAELERNRGMDVKFIKPEPGFVLKTCVNGDMKAFVNCCSNANIGKPESKLTEKNGHRGYQWSIPHSLSPSREDLDKEGKKCQVFDCVFHPDCFSSADKDPRFRKMIEDTALDGIEREFKVKLDRNNLKPLKNMKYKGRMSTTVIRTRSGQGATANTMKDSVSALNLPYPYDTGSADVNANHSTRTTNMNVSSPHGKGFHNEGISQNGETGTDNLPRPRPTSTNISESDGSTVPNYTITHRGVLDMQQFVNAPDSRPSTRPQELVIRINLPLLKSACGIQLDVFTKRLYLETNRPAAASYRLDISLPFPVDENHGSAKFDKSKSCMVVTLPVEPPNVPALPSFAPSLEDKSLVEEINGVETITLQDEICQSNSDDDSAPIHSENGNEKLENSINHSHVNLETATKLPQQDYNVTKHSLTEKALNLQNEKFILPDFSFHQCDESISIVVDVPAVVSATVETQLSQDGRDCWIHFQATVPKRENRDLYGLQLVFPEGSKMSYITHNVSSFNLVFVLHKEDGYCNELHSFQAGPSKGNLQVKKFTSQHSIHDSVCGLMSVNQTQETGPSNVELKTVISSEDGTSQTSLDIELEIDFDTEKKKTDKEDLVNVADSELSIDISTTSSISEHASSPDITPLSPHSLLKSSLRSQRKRSSKSVSFSDEVVVGTFVASQGRKGRKKSPYIRRSKQKLKAPAQEICSDSELVLSYKGGEDSEEDLWNIVPPRRTVHRQSSSESESDGLSSPKGKHKKSKGSRRRRKEKARKALMLEGSPKDTKPEEDVFTEKLSCKESLEDGAVSESLPGNSEISSVGDDRVQKLDDQEAKEEETESDEDGEWTTVTKKRNHRSEGQDGEDKDVVELDKLDHCTQSAVEFSNSVMFDLDD